MRGRKPRRLAPGVVHSRAHDERSRLLTALVSLRIYLTSEVLGLLLALEKGNACNHVLEVLAALETVPVFPFNRSTAERQKLGSVAAVIYAFLHGCLVIEAVVTHLTGPEPCFHLISPAG